MALNANIILGGRPAEIENPQNVLMRKLQADQQRAALQNQEMLQQREMRAIENNALRQRVLAAGGGEDELMRAGFPEDAIKIGEHRRKSKETDAKTAVQQLEATAKRFGLVQTVANGINSPESWAMGRLLLEKEGIPTTALGEQYDPRAIEDLRLQAVTKNDEIKHALARAQQAETGRHNLATEGHQANVLGETRRHNQRSEAISGGNLAVAQGNLGLSRQRLAHDMTKPTEASTKAAEKAGEIDRTLNQFVAARDGLLSALEGTSTGPAVGRITPITAAAQTGEGAVQAMAPVLKAIFRQAGEGTFTDKDQEMLLLMVPTRKDKPEARAAKMANIENIVAAKLGREIPKRAGAFTAQSGAVPGLPEGWSITPVK